jgi:hypothetical protein
MLMIGSPARVIAMTVVTVVGKRRINMRYEIVEKGTFRKKFESYDKYAEEYLKHIQISCGASGQYDPVTKVGRIRSYLKVCRKLELDGYTNLRFPNGGDDDILLIDHVRKEFGFFEDNTPTEEQMEDSKNLTQLWKN